MKPFIVTITGPSCAGKTTLEKMLRDKGFAPVVSTTSRDMRFGEVDGQNYHYVTREQFQMMDATGQLVESIEFGGNLYGVSCDEIQRIANTGKPVVIVVEPNGRDQIIKYCDRKDWSYRSVFISNPDEVIARRFLMRLRDELEGAKNSVGIVNRYAERLATMMSTERGWIAEAHFSEECHDELYDESFFTFDETNSANVVDAIFGCWLRHKHEREGIYGM